MKNNTKLGFIFLGIGFVAVCLGLVIDSPFSGFEREFLGPSFWHLIWSGIFFGIIGVLCILPASKNSEEENSNLM